MLFPLADKIHLVVVIVLAVIIIILEVFLSIQNYTKAQHYREIAYDHVFPYVPQVVQEFVLGVYDAEATADFNQNVSDVSTVKDPHSKDASQRYDFLNMNFVHRYASFEEFIFLRLKYAKGKREKKNLISFVHHADIMLISTRMEPFVILQISLEKLRYGAL